MSLMSIIKTDLNANQNNTKAIFIVVLFRIANYTALHRHFFIRALGFPVRKLYGFTVMWFLNIEIPITTKIGLGFNLGHGSPVVVNADAVLGNYVLLRQFVTIGNKGLGPSGSPVIGDNVEIGANSVIFGEITIGDNVTIGAGSVVNKSVPANSIVYGNPMKIVSKAIQNLAVASVFFSGWQNSTFSILNPFS